MSERHLVRLLAAVLTAQLILSACDVIGVGAPGSRELVIPVDNMSEFPATLFVAENGVQAPMGRSVGTAVPPTVPAGVSQDVIFTVPSGDRWAIFVNPTATRGALIRAREVPPGFTGLAPMVISVAPGGDPGVNMPDDAGSPPD